MGDEIGDELEPEGAAIEDVSIGKGDEHPAGQLGEGGFGDVARDAAAGGMAAGPPQAAVDLHGHLGSRPGEIGAVGRWLTRLEAFLLLVAGPDHPRRQRMLSDERQVRERDQPLIREGLLQMAGHG